MCINFFLPVYDYYYFFTLKVTVANDLHFMNHKRPQFQPKIIFTVLLKKKVSYILDGLRMSKLTAHFNFWVNYHFKRLELPQNDLKQKGSEK